MCEGVLASFTMEDVMFRPQLFLSLTANGSSYIALDIFQYYRSL